MRLVSVDVGSTWTKGALLEGEGSALRVLRRASVPTTVDHLALGFRAVLELLDAPGAAIHFSSSAKGGLAIAAVGLVPALTQKAARMTALSAGGKVTRVYAYKLSTADLDQLERDRPDILLLAGGTDGGNESFVLHNAARLAARRLPLTVVYAGNAAVAEEVQAELAGAGYDVRVAPNVMPELERLEPGGARERIREVFLQRIVKGKGLDEIVALAGREPLPTPAAVLALAEALGRRGFGDFLLVDMGGATTDVYSHGGDSPGSERVVHRGLRDPLTKRTVEGDLGMRISAASAAPHARVPEGEREAFAAYVERVRRDPASLGERFDAALASACLGEALRRHAGTWRRVYTPLGETWVQTGKDLRSVRTLIGSGGYLAAAEDFFPELEVEESGDVVSLTPRKIDYLRDREYLLPLLGNLVGEHEEAAVETALRSLEATRSMRSPRCSPK